MNRTTVILKKDLKTILRDQMLIFLMVLPLIIAAVFRIVYPEVRTLLMEYFDLAEYYVLIMSYLIMITPNLFGWVYGFMLIDERDEGTLEYISVTPLGKERFLLYRIFIPVAVGFVLSLAAALIFGLKELSITMLLPALFLAALETPVWTLFIGSFASNKVEAMAVGKLGTLVFAAPFINYFLETPLKYLASFMPPFWIPGIIRDTVSGGSEVWLSYGAALIVHIAVVVAMLKIFVKRKG